MKTSAVDQSFEWLNYWKSEVFYFCSDILERAAVEASLEEKRKPNKRPRYDFRSVLKDFNLLVATRDSLSEFLEFRVVAAIERVRTDLCEIEKYCEKLERQKLDPRVISRELAFLLLWGVSRCSAKEKKAQETSRQIFEFLKKNGELENALIAIANLNNYDDLNIPSLSTSKDRFWLNQFKNTLKRSLTKNHNCEEKEIRSEVSKSLKDLIIPFDFRQDEKHIRFQDKLTSSDSK